MRQLLCLSAALAALAGAAHAEQMCAANAPDPAVSVSMLIGDDGMVKGGQVHWAVPNVRPDLPSMVHIVYPLDGDHAGTRPAEVMTLNAVTGQDIVHSPTASVQIVIDGMHMAVRAWDLYGQAVEQLTANPPVGGIDKASFVGVVQFTPSFQDGRRDTDSSEALSRLSHGASTLEVRLLGQDGMALQEHTYHLFDMPAPPAEAVRQAIVAAHDPKNCKAAG
jgi:hypothetical protein